MDNLIKALADMIYGEGASTDLATMTMIGSTAINRVNSGRLQEFGEGLGGVLTQPNAYYAVQDNSPMYQQAVSGKFPDKTSENSYKRAMQVASGLIKGTIEPTKGEFYFKPEEVRKLKRKGSKVFNFKNVKRHDDVGGYEVYGY